MVKSELIKQLHQKHSKLNRSYIEEIVDTFFDTIIDSLVKGKPCELRQLGRFSVKTTKEKKSARNPRTSEIIYVPSKIKVTFRMSKHLKTEINKKV